MSRPLHAFIYIFAFTLPPFAWADAEFYKSHVRASAAEIKGLVASGQAKRVVVVPRFESNLSDLNVAMINAVINPRPLTMETLEKVNNALGKNTSDNSCINGLMDSSNAADVLQSELKKNGIAAPIINDPPEPDDIFVSSSVRYSPPNQVVLRAFTVFGKRKFGRSEVVAERQKTIELKPSWLSWIFGSGYAGIKKCLSRRDFAVGVHGCEMKGSNCTGELRCTFSTVNRNLETVRLDPATCDSSCSNLPQCFNKLVEQGAIVRGVGGRKESSPMSPSSGNETMK